MNPLRMSILVAFLLIDEQNIETGTGSTPLTYLQLLKTKTHVLHTYVHTSNLTYMHTYMHFYKYVCKYVCMYVYIQHIRIQPKIAHSSNNDNYA